MQQSPEKEVKGLTFLFQGDSITDSNRSQNTDPNHMIGHGYANFIATRVGADFPEAGHSFYNRGISGNKVPDLIKRWQTDALDIKPDVLSLLIGINDAAAVVLTSPQAKKLTEFETGYRQLIDASKVANPELLVILGIPFVYPVGTRKNNWDLWESETGKRAEVVRKIAIEFNAILVDYPMAISEAIKKAPAEYWVWDGVHPTAYGYEIMAREWIKQAGRRLPFLDRKYK